MELGPRDRLSQAFWHEKQKGRTIKTPHGDVVHLDLRHLGEKKMRERLPQMRELAQDYVGVDPAHEPIPVLPAVHYTMGGITPTATPRRPCPACISAGECSSVGIHGANRLGSNSLTEMLVFGARAGRGGGGLRQSAIRRARRRRQGARGARKRASRDCSGARAAARPSRPAQGDERHHGKRRRHLPQRGHAAGDLRQPRRASARTQGADCRTAAMSSTPI